MEDKPSPQEGAEMMQFSLELIHQPLMNQRQMSHPMASHPKTDDNIHLHPSKHTTRKQIEVGGNAKA